MLLGRKLVFKMIRIIRNELKYINENRDGVKMHTIQN